MSTKRSRVTRVTKPKVWRGIKRTKHNQRRSMPRNTPERSNPNLLVWSYFSKCHEGLHHSPAQKMGLDFIWSLLEIWCGAKNKARQVGKSCISLLLNSFKRSRCKQVHTNQQNCDLNGGPNQHIWLLCSSHRLCCLYEGFLISATCTGHCYAFPLTVRMQSWLRKIRTHQRMHKCCGAKMLSSL